VGSNPASEKYVEKNNKSAKKLELIAQF